MAAENEEKYRGRRLSSWKEIAAFVGRDERTVKRWEDSRGLPVRRVPGAGRASIFAYVDEIEAWMRGGEPRRDAPPIPPAPEPPGAAGSPVWRPLALAGILVVVLVVGAAIYLKQNAATGIRLPELSADSHDPVAAELFRSGMHAWQTRSPSGLARAVADFTEAVKRDPHFARAYEGLAEAYDLEAEFTDAPRDQYYPEAAVAARRAIALDPSLSGAHAALAFTDFYWTRDTAAADREFKRSLALDPRSATAHQWYATFLMTSGKPAQALAEIEKAQDLDSESTAIPADKALILFHGGDAKGAVKLLTQLENDDPGFASPHRYLATIWLAQGQDAAYLKELRLAAQARHDAQGVTLADAGAKGFITAGHAGMLRAILAVERRLYAANRESAFELADTCAELGDGQGALAYLSTSIARREADNIAIGVDPAFAGLRNDSSFATLAARAGFGAPR